MKPIDEKEILGKVLLPLNSEWSVSEVFTNERTEEIFVKLRYKFDYVEDNEVRYPIFQRIFAAMQAKQILAIHVEILALDSTSCKAHPNAHSSTGSLTAEPLKKGKQSMGRHAHQPSVNPRVVGTPSIMWYPQMIRS
jgi:hypothetical protein